MVREMQSLREMACDEQTLAALDVDQRAELCQHDSEPGGTACPVAARPGNGGAVFFASQTLAADRAHCRRVHLVRGEPASPRADCS